MSSIDEQDEADVNENGVLKHKAPSGNSPIAKRMHIDTVSEQEERQDQEQDVDVGLLDLTEEERMVSETDVGIAAYVNESLVPISGGIIKHRYVLSTRA